jgi:hypothetical protein
MVPPESAANGFDEHWGEVAYVGAMAFHSSGRTDQTLRTHVMHFVNGFSNDGSAIATPFNLQ